jgi:hypothetical protein
MKKEGSIMLKETRKIILFGIGAVAALILSDTYVKANTQPGTDCATATPIALNTEGHGAFRDVNDRVVYRIVLEHRGLFDVWTEAGNLDLWSVELLDSSCNAVAGAGPGESVIANGYMRITVPSINLDPSRSVWTLDSATYFLRFIPNSVDVFREPFIFHTSYTPHYGHGFKSAEPIDIPGSINGALLYPMDREVFRFTLSEPAAIHAWTTGTTSLLVLPPVNLGFADLSSARKNEFNKGPQNEIVTTLLEPGTYYLFALPATSEMRGGFILHVQVTRTGP